MNDAELDAAIEAARDRAHNAPLNKVFQDHTGHKYLGTHSNAWAKAGAEYCDLLAEKMRRQVSS